MKNEKCQMINAKCRPQPRECPSHPEGSPPTIPRPWRRALRLVASLSLFCFGQIARAQDASPGTDLAVEWHRFRDLETLVARVESEGLIQDKTRREPVTRLSWGTRLKILPGPDLLFPVEDPTEDAERAFLSAYRKEYRAAVDGARTGAMEIAAELALVKEPGDDFTPFAQRFLARYKLDGLALSPKDSGEIAAKKRASAEIVRFATRLPEWEKEFAPILDADEAGLDRELQRRMGEAKKLVKRFDLGKDLGSGQLSGSSVFDVRLGPMGLEFAKNAAAGLRATAVVGPDGAPWKVNGEPLLVCSEKSLPDVNSYVKDIRNEYVVFRYRQLGVGDTKTKDVIRLVCARLYLGPRYFLFFRDRVILFLKDRPGR